MIVFWTKGYDGATIDDLVAGMGVGRPSLYTIFGDKETLFLKCLHHYIQKFGGAAIQALQTAPTAKDAIRGFLQQAVMRTTIAGWPRGCLMGNVASVVIDTNIRKFTVRAMAQPLQIIEQRLRAAVIDGELPADFDCARRARQVIDLSMGMALRARLGAPREELLRDADDGVALFF